MKQVITDKELLLLVETQPKITAAQVAEFYDVTSATANSRLKRLFTRGKLNRANVQTKGVRGVVYGYSLSNGEYHEPVPQKLKRPTAVAYQARLDELSTSIAELEEWRAEAIRRYPDLAVPEIVLRARSIAAKSCPEHADALIRGVKDESPIMRAVIAALEETL